MSASDGEDSVFSEEGEEGEGEEVVEEETEEEEEVQGNETYCVTATKTSGAATKKSGAAAGKTSGAATKIPVASKKTSAPSAGKASGAAAGKTSTTKHRTYQEMVQETVIELGGKKGISKSKISEYMKGRYELNELNNLHVVKAIKTLIEKKIIENVTGMKIII